MYSGAGMRERIRAKETLRGIILDEERGTKGTADLFTYAGVRAAGEWLKYVQKKRAQRPRKNVRQRHSRSRCGVEMQMKLYKTRLGRSVGLDTQIVKSFSSGV